MPDPNKCWINIFIASFTTLIYIVHILVLAMVAGQLFCPMNPPTIPHQSASLQYRRCRQTDEQSQRSQNTKSQWKVQGIHQWPEPCPQGHKTPTLAAWRDQLSSLINGAYSSKFLGIMKITIWVSFCKFPSGPWVSKSAQGITWRVSSPNLV